MPKSPIFTSSLNNPIYEKTNINYSLTFYCKLSTKIEDGSKH